MGASCQSEEPATRCPTAGAGSDTAGFPPSSPAASPPCGTPARRLTWVSACAALLASLLLYAPTLFHDFVNIDDPVYVSANPNLGSLSPPFLGWAFGNYTFGNWAPLLWLSYGLDCTLWGLNPLGYHLSNVALHGFNAALVVLLAAKLGAFAALAPEEQDFAAAVAGLLFAVHPVHVESVAWVADRKDLLATLFCLLSTLTYLRHAASRPPRGWRGVVSSPLLASGGLYACATMSKVTAVILPAAFLLLDRYPLGRLRSRADLVRSALEKTPHLAVGAASLAMSWAAARGLEIVALDQSLIHPLAARLRIALHAVSRYLRDLLLPAGAAPFSATTTLEAPPDVAFWSVALLAALTLASWLLRRRLPALGASWAFLLLTLSPTLGVVRIFGVTSVADRFLYLPSLGPLLAVAVAAALLRRRAGATARRALHAGILVALGVLATMSWRQAAIWKDSVSLWAQVLRQSPTSDFAHLKLAEAYENLQQYEKAVESYSAAIAIYAFEPETYLGRGRALARLGLGESALQDLSTAIALEEKRRYVKPVEHLRRDLARYHDVRGRILMSLSRYQEALADWEAAASLGGASVDLDAARGSALVKLGRYQEALPAFARVLAAHPTSPWAHFSLAEALSALGREREAAGHYLQAAEAGWEPAREALARRGRPR